MRERATGIIVSFPADACFILEVKSNERIAVTGVDNAHLRKIKANVVKIVQA